ncbi:hypothetical protein KI387_001028, partial [Taxus chinensis]
MFLVKCGKNTAVVEADAFKETSSVYQTLNSSGHNDLLKISELVHQTSTDATESLLVITLNEGRDTIAMTRDVHPRQYRRGPGHQRGDNDSVQENYWETVEDIDPREGTEMIQKVVEKHEEILCKETSHTK